MSEDERDKRLRSSILLESEDQVVVIDTGPDFRQQMLRTNVNKLDAVLFTHEHRDHVAGLDDIRSFNFLQKSPMDVYAERRVMHALKRGFPYVFTKLKYPGVPQIKRKIISVDPFAIGPMEIVPVRVMHHRLPVLGFRIGDFAYLTDCNYVSEKEKGKLRGLRYLVVCALRRETHISHFTLSQAIDLIGELNPEVGYLTHISHQMGLSALLETELPSNIRLAYDGLVLEL